MKIDLHLPYISPFDITVISINSFAPNARLRGWQRITTKPKHNNRNHRGSMGLETPRVDSPS
ncbi:hypothetical protein FLL86_19770 [Vibrio cholerae]|nr:hypothetical protein FLL86_19770 [Vibrio cholerae]